MERFSPLLIAQARYRLGPLAAEVGAEDVAAEAWLVALPRLDRIEEQGGRFTPVFLRYLGGLVRNVANNHLRAALRRKARGEEASPFSLPEEHSASQSGVVSRAAGNELARRVASCLGQLSEEQRTVVILRGIEGRSNEEAAELLGEIANTVSRRYRRALQRLRECLPGSVFDELES